MTEDFEDDVDPAAYRSEPDPDHQRDTMVDNFDEAQEKVADSFAVVVRSLGELFRLYRECAGDPLSYRRWDIVEKEIVKQFRKTREEMLTSGIGLVDQPLVARTFRHGDKQILDSIIRLAGSMHIDVASLDTDSE